MWKLIDIDMNSGCKVSITCMDERSRVIYYGSDITDELGQYDLVINKHINGKELKSKLCTVRLVSSPDQTCNVLTNFGGGRSGVKLNSPSSVYRDLIKHTLAPFYYTSPLCDEPDTTTNTESESQDSYGNNH